MRLFNRRSGISTLEGGSRESLVPVRDILYDGQIGTGKLGVLEKIMSGYDFIRDSTILHGIF